MQNGWTVLHGAARYGRQEMVTYLLEAGCDANARDNVRAPASLFADVLSPADISPRTKDAYLSLFLRLRLLQKGWTALVYACEHGHTEAVLALMSAGADCNVQTNVRHC